MKVLTRLGGIAVLAAAMTAAAAGTASAATYRSPGGRGAAHVVFLQTDDTAGNHVVTYDRAGDGTLKQAGTAATGGLGYLMVR